ncbi:MAG TPA: DUF5681 domain-containing protein [Holophagaceae bacterium]|nr:DUF5681 domain-containing protein [Holophagaceae bacterium]
MAAKRPYAVGYGKPPRASQFTQGQSGNPAGRPKGARNLTTVLKGALEERVVVTERGRPRSLSKLEVMVKQLVNKAAGGDLRAFAQVQGLLERELGDPGTRMPEALHEEDQQVLRRLFERMKRDAKGEIRGLEPKEGSDEPTD